jgi:hypothetical protein
MNVKTINNSERQGSPPFQGAYPTLDYLTTIFDLDKELKMEKNGWIYIWINIINKKKRIGHTINLNQRIRQHIQDIFVKFYKVNKNIIKDGQVNI